MFSKLPQNIIQDLSSVKNEVENLINKIGFFGSIKYKDYNNVNDIDVIIFVKRQYFKFLYKKMAQLNLSLPVIISSLNGRYNPSIKKGQYEKCYHITIMDAESPNINFMEISQKEIVYF